MARAAPTGAQPGIMSPKASTFMPGAGGHPLTPIKSLGKSLADVNELADFLRDKANVSESIIKTTMDKLQREEVLVVNDLLHLRKVNGLGDVFSRVTASKVAEALDALERLSIHQHEADNGCPSSSGTDMDYNHTTAVDNNRVTAGQPAGANQHEVDHRCHPPQPAAPHSESDLADTPTHSSGRLEPHGSMGVGSDDSMSAGQPDEKTSDMCEKGPTASGANPATHVPLEEKPVCATVLHATADGPPGPDTTPAPQPISGAKPDRLPTSPPLDTPPTPNWHAGTPPPHPRDVPGSICYGVRAGRDYGWYIPMYAYAVRNSEEFLAHGVNPPPPYRPGIDGPNYVYMANQREKEEAREAARAREKEEEAVAREAARARAREWQEQHSLRLRLRSQQPRPPLPPVSDKPADIFSPSRPPLTKQAWTGGNKPDRHLPYEYRQPTQIFDDIKQLNQAVRLVDARHGAERRQRAARDGPAPRPARRP